MPITQFPYKQYYPETIKKLRAKIEQDKSFDSSFNEDDKRILSAWGMNVPNLPFGYSTGRLTILPSVPANVPFDWRNIDYELQLRLHDLKWPVLDEGQKWALFFLSQEASLISEARRERRQAIFQSVFLSIISSPLAKELSSIPGISPTGGKAITASVKAGLTGTDPIKAAAMSALTDLSNNMNTENQLIIKAALDKGIKKITDKKISIEKTVTSDQPEILPPPPFEFDPVIYTRANTTGFVIMACLLFLIGGKL